MTLTTILLSAALSLSVSASAQDIDLTGREGIKDYEPTQEVFDARERFRESKFGVFIHWGIYSMMADGEWVMQKQSVPYADYSQLAAGFCPSNFNADEWVAAIKDAGAKYITITSRHHDGFSMFATKASPYNIVDATPFRRDVLKELADACQRQGMTLNFYYSLLDWGRGDYPTGSSGEAFAAEHARADYQHYADFMCEQITELLTNYGPIGCIWFDGDWDQIRKPAPGEEVKVGFDWQYERIYSLIHKLQPSCLVGNNHHRINIPGEDIQIFERDVPGENTAGYSRTSVISHALPLETCQTMNRSWGYKITDHEFKSVDDIVRLLVRTAGRDANLLMNVGPQPDGRIPATSLQRFAEVGKWMRANGETIYGTRATLLGPQPWGVVTHKEGKIWIHVLERPADGIITLPFTLKTKQVCAFADGTPLTFKKTKTDFTVQIPEDADCTPDYIVEITLK